MTDLELIIKELEERIENFKKDAELGPLEPDGHYTLKDIQILKSQLRTFQYFHPEHKKLVEKQDRKRQDEIRETVLRNALISKLKWLSEKTLSLEEYEQKLTQIIKSHMRHLQAKTRVESKEPEEINLADSDTIQIPQQRQDKVYELTEAVYDGLLDKFEVRIPVKYLEITSFSLERKENNISITLQPKASRYSFESHKSVRNTILKKIGYTLSEGWWKYTFDIKSDLFENLITVVARTLIEIFGTIDKEIEVIYQEYDS